MVFEIGVSIHMLARKVEQESTGIDRQRGDRGDQAGVAAATAQKFTLTILSSYKSTVFSVSS